VAPKIPIGRLADAAIKSLKDPVGTAGKVVEQAKGSAALGKMVAEQVGKSAMTKATETVGAVTSRRGEQTPPSTHGESSRDTSAPLRSVPDVNEPGHTPAENRTSEPSKQHGDILAGVKKAPAKKAPAKKAAATKAPAKKAAAKKTADAPAAPSPADVAKLVEAAVAEDPAKTAATPVAKTAEKAAAKTPAHQGAPGDKLPTKKAPAKKGAADQAAAKKAAKKTPPRTAAQLAAGDTDDVTTPVGTSAAGQGSNPDTTEQDLNQPGTEGILDESTVKAVASETAALRKAAERNPE
jgi:hypothetical protein